VKLCQVGIEQVQRSAQRKTSVEKFREETESLRILRALPRWALSECIGAQEKEDRTVGSSVKKILCQVGIELVCRQAQEKRTL
jgi:hypothetical protein